MIDEKKIVWPLVGNSHIVNFLEKVINKQKVEGVYIFNGPDNLGKTTLAVHFVKILQCTGKVDILPCDSCKSCINFTRNGGLVSGDFHLLKQEKDKKNISVEQVRDFILALNMTSFLSKYRIGIIKHADKLSNQASNALLKTLEEPKKNVVIILITTDSDLLPATILSRSKILNFHSVRSGLIYDYLINDRKATRDQAKRFSRISAGRPALARKFLEDKDFFEKYKVRADIFLNLAYDDINKSVLLIDSLFDKKSSNNESVKIVKRVLEIWQGLARDIILLKSGNEELVQHNVFSEELEMVKQKFSDNQILDIFKKIKNAEGYLERNVNSKLILEEILLTT